MIRLHTIADDKGPMFTDVVLDLLRRELKGLGVTLDIGREAVKAGSEAGSSDKRDGG